MSGTGESGRRPGALRRAARHGPADWWMLARVILAFAAARIAFSRGSEAALVAGLQSGPSTADAPPAEPERLAFLRRLRWAVHAASQRLPWRSDCMVSCLAAHRILRREGIGSEFFIGVARDGAEALAAHAWLVSHGVTVAGDVDLTRYTVLLDADGRPARRSAREGQSTRPARPG